MNLSINSNLSVPELAWKQFIELIIQIQKDNAIEKFYLHPSIDTFGKRAEYIRHGLNFNIFQNEFT